MRMAAVNLMDRLLGQAAGRQKIERRLQVTAFLCTLAAVLVMAIFPLVDYPRTGQRDPAPDTSVRSAPTPAPSVAAAQPQSPAAVTQPETGAKSAPESATRDVSKPSEALNETLK